MDKDFGLILNAITQGEYIVNITNADKFEDYKQMAFLFLGRKGRFLYEQDILKMYSDNMTLEKIFAQESHRFIQGANHKKDGKMQKTWHDIYALEEVSFEDDFFDYFLTLKLRHIGLLEIDAFLEYHLDYSFKSNKKEYNRFLNLVLRKHHDTILNPIIVESVKEWIKQNEIIVSDDKSALSSEQIKSKGKIKRERDDKVTQLNQEQTALLIYCMRQTRIILKDEYLNYKEAGQAFSILTGYSSETLRQSLNKAEQTRISTKKNNDAVKKVLKDLILYIEDNMEPEV